MAAAVTVTAVLKFLSTLLPQKSLSQNVISLSPTPASLQLPKTKSSAWAPLVTDRVQKISSDDDLTSVVWPSLANGNVFFFNVQIDVADDEPEEKMVRRFRSAVLRAGIIQECRRRRFFESSQEKRKRKARSAAQRNRKRRPIPKTRDKLEAPKANKDEDEDDNWEGPDGEVPYS